MIDLRLGDCLEVMKKIPDKSIDLVLTDPPYGLPNENFEDVRKAVKECSRISLMQIYFLDWRNPLSLKDNKFAELIWEYGWISGGRTKSNHFYPTHNTIHFCGKNSFNFESKIGSIINRRPGFSSPRQCSYAKKSGHPFEKPKELIKYLIKRTIANTILDPFMGSGTTGVACKELGRNFIGIEINKQWFEIAKRGIDNTTENLL